MAPLYLSRFEQSCVRIAQLTGPLIAKGPDGYDCAHGTAFLIGDRLAVTAAHVITGYLQHVHGIELLSDGFQPRRRGSRIELDFVLLLPNTDLGQVQFEVVRTTVFTPGDIALLELGNAKNYPWQNLAPYPSLRIAGPRLGEWVLALGYPTTRVRRKNLSRVLLATSLTGADGLVTEVTHQSSDPHSRRFPRFQTNASYRGGMSGSPIVGEDGCVCGVVASSLESDLEEDTVSFGSILWPLARAKATCRQKHRASTRKPRSIIHSKIVHVADFDALPEPILNLAIPHPETQGSPDSADA